MIGNKKEVLVKSFLVLGFIFVIVGVSYAIFQVSLLSRKTNRLKTSRLSLKITDKYGQEESSGYGINYNNLAPMSDEEGLNTMAYEFNLVNDGILDADYEIFLDDASIPNEEERMDDIYIRYNLSKNESAPNPKQLESRKIDLGTIKSGETNRYVLRFWIAQNSDNGSMDKIFSVKVRVEGVQHVHRNYIVTAYNYSEDTSSPCVNGEESTCTISKCYENTEAGSCPAGTIIKYQVNGSEQKYFNVLHDDGETLTLQQREDTLSQVRWGSINTAGPVTALEALETETASWENVNDLTYQLGTTSFLSGASANTGCVTTSYPYNCNTNRYTLPERTGKARMVTYYELTNVGCTNASNSCPVFIYNYLQNINHSLATPQGEVSKKTWGYWSMNSATYNNMGVIRIYDFGGITTGNCDDGHLGVRAVVEVNK